MNALRASKTHYVFFRMFGKPYLRAMVLPFAAILFSVAMADANVDWTALRARIAGLKPLPMAALFTALFLAWSTAAGRALRPLWQQPVTAFLSRQPLSDTAWAIYLFPSLAIALVPVIAAWWLAPQAAGPIGHYAGFAMLALPMVLGASCRGLASIRIVTSAAFVLLLCAWAYPRFPAVAYLTLVLAVVGSKLALNPIRRQVVQVYHNVYAPLAGSGIVTTLLRRDLRYLLRKHGKNLLGFGLLSGICVLLMLAFRINGELQGREALLSACVFLSILATPLYEALEALKTGLGKELMRRRWPVTYRQRGAALVALIGGLLLPGAASILLIGASMGPANTLGFLLFASVIVTGSGALLGRHLLARRSANGVFLLFIAGHAVLMLALPVAAYCVIAVIVLPLAFESIARSFRRFTATTERTSIEQLT